MAAGSSSGNSCKCLRGAESTASPARSRSAHDIFLSHSGKQKGFVKGLYTMLHRRLYSVFFDITHHSLPPADNFPTHIFSAAKTCKLAVVVLSNEFLSSKWPMLELSAFMDAMPPSGNIKILPLFYELYPSDLKDEKKLQGWHKKWEEFASKDGTGRINVSTWVHALRTLCSISGLVFNKSDGELAYLEEIVSTISQILPPLIKSTYPGIHGEDHLCQVIIDKFEELESRHHPTSFSKVCVLGVYGLPGSGKSTLSKCLCDRFFPLFGGKVLHLELPTDPTPAELLNKSKELLKLTDFHDRADLSNTELDLGQVYSILKASNLRSSSVFLVIDNISSQDSIQSVEAILALGLGTGSRVMLVARTLKILHPLLTFRYKGHHNVCDSMRVPSIDEEEAIRVLMQPVAGLGVAEYNNKAEEELSRNHKEIMVKVVRMCAFHDDSKELLYLPLVLKIMGSQLRSYGMDLEMWERRLRSLQEMVEKFKEDAVRQIVEESFEKLPKKLKLLFLDVALFMVPYFQHAIDYEAKVELLSFMHESSPETIKLELQELIRLCFLDLRYSTMIIVHDVFLGFAKCESDAFMYYCKKRNLNMSADVQIREMRLLHSKSNAGLRAIILELDEKCERFDFPAGFASVKVLIVRNCRLLAVLGLEGLTSLVSLEVVNCPSLRFVELGAGAEQNHLQYSLKSVKWTNGLRHDYENIYDQQQGSFMQMKPGTQEQSIMQAKPAWKGTLLEYMRWCRMLALSRCRPQRPWNGVIDLARQVRGLQVLRLEGTGITCLGDASSCWPQLRVLEVLEHRLEQIELGNLPNLECFFFGDGVRYDFLEFTYFRMNEEISCKLRMPRQTNLLVGCPKLEDVRICEPSCEDGMATLKLSSNLHTFSLKHVRHAAPMLPDLTSVAQSLEVLVVHDHWSLRSVDFTCQFSRVVQISLWSCRSLTKITGLEGLPNLRDLQVDECASLGSLSSLTKIFTGLERLVLTGCPLLNVRLLGLNNWVSLKELHIHGCPNVHFLLGDLANLAKLRVIECQLHSFPCFFNIRNLVNLDSLDFHISDLDSELLMLMLMNSQCEELSLCHDVEVNGERSSALEIMKCDEVNGGAALEMKCLPSLLIGPSHHLSRLELDGVKNLVSLDGSKFLVTLRSLKLRNLRNLVSLDGIEFLLTLESLQVYNLPNLKCLQGIECLIHLQSFDVRRCMCVEELPSLRPLVNMEFLYVSNCVNLKALQGCDAMRCLTSVDLSGCKQLECLPAMDRATLDLRLQDLIIKGCKFANVKATVAWVLHEEVPKILVRASLEALEWEFIHNLLEKPTERRDLGVVLVQTLGVYLSRQIKVQCLKNECFDFHDWVTGLEMAWERRKSSPPITYPGALMELIQKVGRVPFKRLLQQCQSDTQFQFSIVHCLIETHPLVLKDWISNQNFLQACVDLGVIE